MSKIELRPPLIITSRLMAGIKIEDSTIHIEQTGNVGEYGKPQWRYIIDAPDFTYRDTELYGWGDTRQMMESLLSFLYAGAEAYEYERVTGREAENADLFPEHVNEWASFHSDIIMVLPEELRGE